MQVSSIDADGLLPIAIEEIHTVPLTTCPVEDLGVVIQHAVRRFVRIYVSRSCSWSWWRSQLQLQLHLPSRALAILDELVMKLIA